MPWSGLFLLFCLWALIIVVALFKGGEGESIIGVECGGVVYWFLWALPFPIFAAVLVYLCTKTRRTHTQKALLNYPFQVSPRPMLIITTANSYYCFRLGTSCGHVRTSSCTRCSAPQPVSAAAVSASGVAPSQGR